MAMITRRIGCSAALALASIVTCSAGAGAAGRNWAASEIRTVTRAGILGSSSAAFAPQAALTQSALADAIAVTDGLQNGPVPTPPVPQPLTIVSTVGAGATISGEEAVAIDAPGSLVGRVDFAVDGLGVHTALAPPFELELDTHTLSDGLHQLAVSVSLAGGGSAIALWNVTVANAQGTGPVVPQLPVAVPIVRSSLPKVAAPAAVSAPRALYRAVVPAQAVSVRQLDAALVGYLGLGDAARSIQGTLVRAGLQPRPNTGTETVARMLGLRLNHPAGQDDLELLPSQAVTRAEAAWSFAQVLALGGSAPDAVRQEVAALSLPELTPWQRRILSTAVSFVGYPYVWGGTSPSRETLFGVQSVGGFDCSGFVWRVYKQTTYEGERGLAGALRGRTTYQMSGEVPRRDALPATSLQPGDVMFFGAHGPASKPSEVDHAALYLGGGWFVHSSDEGVTLHPFDGWYSQTFAWARRPLHEAGLD